MSGLFTRLAQQHICGQVSDIKSAREPVFPVETLIKENHLPDNLPQQEHVTSNNDELTQSMNKPETGIIQQAPKISASLSEIQYQNETVDNTRDIDTSISTLKTHAVHTIPGQVEKSELPVMTDDTQQLNPLLAPLLLINTETLPGHDHQPINKDGLHDSHIDHEVDISRLSSRHSVITQATPAVSNHDQKTSFLPEIEPVVQHENQTTINVSIGQIDIKASHEQPPRPNKTAYPTKNSTNALEEYHRKRVRGDQ